MKRATILPVLLFAFLFTACIKEEKIRYKLSGVWEIDKAEITYYENGSAVRDTVVKDFGYFLFEDNAVDGYSRCHYKFNKDGVLRSIRQVANHFTGLNTQEDDCRWSSDWYESKRLNLIASGEYYDYFLTFTLDKKSKNKYEWVYVERGQDSLNLGSMAYKEVITVKRVTH